ncbi:nuclear pore complex protein Nup50 [Parambassis ranga]|uniref:Nuclear pore complex protein Nup50 n=1 Tax=Parambassis ranga TaxID=210632 RepID=A0A6P7HIC5_9TELE|nr:nuclear pore complex protein Nup50 [Parambassis ranga]XP_028250284.1 nuclear pore complex protein Nup50 [Parambassis ranga]XP_028250292.1 nuclear pore complex protein Nup50 [Parambassis ranga]XP_028250301.1 nuclear pore complex protein Nup50 [Parambassis ranga]XP_028250310.1 nuclear pore complex protein Nup50 [Parambassis ranga]
MAKRIADKELTDRNWDQEEEGEEAGTFSVASEDVLKNRAIKKAKRRNTGAESESPGAFKGFKGFSLTMAASSGGSTQTAFSGFGNGGGFKGLGALTNGSNSTSTFGGFSTAAPGLTFNGPSPTKPSADITTQQTNGSAPSSSQSSGSCSSSNKEYSRQLTALNCSVRDWITKHVNDNPLCDLNPIFRDYERHLASIERQYGAGSADGGSEEKPGGMLPSTATPLPPSSSSSSSSAAPAAAAMFSFSKTTSEDSTSEKSSAAAPTPAGVTFNFGQKVDSSVLGSLGSKSTTPSFSFSSSQKSLFGAPGAAAPLSFSTAKTEDAQPAENGEEESEDPPKPEVKEVKEEDAFYSKKCKLFYKKEAEFKEKGVGTLHLKQAADGKTQMIIRADTNLGNILLNIMLQPSMPCSQVGKNNVMVVCVPNPPIDDKNPSSPVPLLIRVKTAEDADELHKTLEEKKG